MWAHYGNALLFQQCGFMRLLDFWRIFLIGRTLPFDLSALLSAEFASCCFSAEPSQEAGAGGQAHGGALCTAMTDTLLNDDETV
jgi:hypothetical protein